MLVYRNRNQDFEIEQVGRDRMKIRLLNGSNNSGWGDVFWHVTSRQFSAGAECYGGITYHSDRR